MQKCIQSRYQLDARWCCGSSWKRKEFSDVVDYWEDRHREFVPLILALINRFTLSIPEYEESFTSKLDDIPRCGGYWLRFLGKIEEEVQSRKMRKGFKWVVIFADMIVPIEMMLPPWASWAWRIWIKRDLKDWLGSSKSFGHETNYLWLRMCASRYCNFSYCNDSGLMYHNRGKHEEQLKT